MDAAKGWKRSTRNMRMETRTRNERETVWERAIRSSATLETERYRLGGSVENSFRPVTGVGHLPNEPLAATVCMLPVENAERT